MKIGFIGLGNMGSGMANNILEKIDDKSNLFVYTRTPEKIAKMADKGAVGCSSLKEITTSVDILLTCLPNVETSRELFMNSGGICDYANSNQILVDHSTVDVKTSQDCFEFASKKGINFLDAPISGGPGGAADGTLTIMVGGNLDSFKIAENAFSMMGKKISHMGPSGAGTAMKLVNQLLVSTNTVAAAEAFVLAEQAGVNLESAIDILNTSWGKSMMIERNGPITVEKEFENSPAPLRNLVKDLGIIKELTDQLGLELPVTKASSSVVDTTMSLGLNEPDIAATALSIKKLSNID
jgi:3-hydroxyisobutyrate dehydrogenase-like beta-hydroxyacid dehydrogenase